MVNAVLITIIAVLIGLLLVGIALWLWGDAEFELFLYTIMAFLAIVVIIFGTYKITTEHYEKHLTVENAVEVTENENN